MSVMAKGLTREAVEELSRRAPKQGEAAAFIRAKGEASASDVQKKTGVRQVNALLFRLGDESILSGDIASTDQATHEPSNCSPV